MDIKNFVKLRPYLYHLTDESNLNSIKSDFTLKSTVVLAGIIDMPNKDEFLHTRRVGHAKLSNERFAFFIRDQDPLSEKITKKNLVGGMTFREFVYLLNSRVFFWAKENDLKGHYKRYENQGERPVVFKIETGKLFAANQHEPKFCRLNSGAPRCSSYYQEGAPPRGRNTFLYAKDYEGTPSSIREVTFENTCKLPQELYISDHPDKPYIAV